MSKTLGELADIARQAWMDCPLDGDHWQATASAVRKAVLEEAMHKTSALEAPLWDDMQPDERAANEGWNEALENVLSSLQRLKDQRNDAT